MRRIRITALCLALVLTTGVIVATSASAKLPEWGRCVAGAKGKYRNAACTEPVAKRAEGSYEWKHSPNNEVIRNGAGEAVLETVGGTKIRCSHFEGELWIPETTDTVVTDVHLTFVECVEPKSGASCQNGAKGEIKSTKLQGVLGYIAGGGTETPSVGLSLAPAPGQGALAEFTCPELRPEQIVLGKPGGGGHGDSVIATITPVDLMTPEFKLTYSETSGVQSPTKFEGEGNEDVLEMSFNGRKGAFEQTGLLLETPYSSGSVEREVRAYEK